MQNRIGGRGLALSAAAGGAVLLVAASTLFAGKDVSHHDHHAMRATGGMSADAQDAAHRAHPADATKQHEHAAMLELLPEAEATHRAVASGPWSARQTWQDGKVPGRAARIVIPAGTEVTVDGDLQQTGLQWLRIDGALDFAPVVKTSLRAETFVVGEKGRLSIGTPDRPISASARLVFAPRQARDRAGDPQDLAGGLISHGVVTMHGASKTPFALAAEDLRQGMNRIRLGMPAKSWAVGDDILIPGVDPMTDQDERLTLKAVEAGGRVIELSRALKFDHAAPIGAAIPVANLTRNVVVMSEKAEPLSARGHIMLMHVQTGHRFDGVQFVDLGRTDARLAHTVPQLGEDGVLIDKTDANTIGRYPLHFHIRSGAKSTVAPHVVANCVVIGGPKHGIVNHGGNVVAEGNVTYNLAGSHFFAENGSEIGTFRNNLAVRSKGSGDIIRARDLVYDFGHGGHGFWSQSGGVRMIGNYAFGHAESAYAIFGYQMVEEGKVIAFDTANTANAAYADPSGQTIISNISFLMDGNTAAGSNNGIDVWNHKLYAPDDERSLIQNSTVWGVKTHAVFLPYTKNVTVRNLRAVNDIEKASSIGVAGNSLTENVIFEGLSLDGFAIGVRMPQRGVNVLKTSRLRNRIDVEMASANLPGRMTQLLDVSLSEPATGHERIALRDLRLPDNASAAMIFEKDEFYLADANGSRRLYFPSQNPSFVAQGDEVPETVRGLTSQQISERYGLAFGGALAPSDAVQFEGSNALSAAVETVPEAKVAVGPSLVAGATELYPLASKQFRKAETSDQVADRWEVMRAAGDAGAESHAAMVYVQRTPPRFIIAPGLVPLEIHPADLRFGYRAMGVVANLVGSKIAVRAFSREYAGSELNVDPDGFVRLEFTVHDMAGNEAPVKLALKVTDKAVQRGDNLDFFQQAAFCGKCGYDTLYDDVRKEFGNVATLAAGAAYRDAAPANMR